MATRSRSRTGTRTRVRREPRRGRYTREEIDRVLDRGCVAHVSFAAEGQPYCIPTLYARVADEVLIHGSSASRMVRHLSTGAPACLTVTVFDGWVLARSVFEHSANYDSAVLLGSFRALEAEEEKLAGLRAFTDKALPGRWSEVRSPSRKELKATAILAMPIAEASVKTRAGGPDDDDSPDAALEVWAGWLPVTSRYGEPVPSPGLREGIAVPRSVVELGADGRAPCQG